MGFVMDGFHEIFGFYSDWDWDFGTVVSFVLDWNWNFFCRMILILCVIRFLIMCRILVMGLVISMCLFIL